MRRSLSALIACSVLLLLAAGCGSSSKSSGSATSGTSTAARSAKSSGGLVPSSTPRYASPEASAPVLSGTVRISYHDITINPDAVKVKVGSTIKWTNEDEAVANVTSEGGPAKFASGNLHLGSTFELKVNKPGTIHYESTYHPVTMNGTIEVVG